MAWHTPNINIFLAPLKSKLHGMGHDVIIHQGLHKLRLVINLIHQLQKFIPCLCKVYGCDLNMMYSLQSHIEGKFQRVVVQNKL